MTRTSSSITYLFPVSLAITLALPTIGKAQEATPAFVLEEIIVTAQRREQTLQEVPISVRVMPGAKLEQAGLERLEEIQAYIPNLTMSETGVGNNIYVRGIGSGINPGFEQSTAMFVDGVHYGRGQLYRAPIFDMQRVEVLRGPQSTLFGKNSIAGAISMTTRSPAREFGGSIGLSYVPEFGEREATAVITGPISDALAGRLSFRTREADGHLRNTFLNRDEPGRSEGTGRLQLRWDVSDVLSLGIKYEQNNFDINGRQVEIIDDVAFGGPLGYFGMLTVPSAVPLQFAPDNTTVVLSGFGQDPSVLDTDQDFDRTANGDYSNNDSDNFTVRATYELGDMELTAISSSLSYEFSELCDCDFSGANGFNVFLDEEYEQFSQEIRLESPVGERIEWLAGLHYQTSELSTLDRISLPANTFLDQAATALAYEEVLNQVLPSYLALVGTVFPDAATAAAAAYVDSLNGNAAFGVRGAAQLGGALPSSGANRTLDQENDSIAVFGQLNWDYSDRLRLAGSARYSREEKEAQRVMALTAEDGSAYVGNPTLGLLAYSLFEVQLIGHDISGSRTDSSFDWGLNAQFELTPSNRVYASVATGFKAGGFDGRSNALPGLATDGSDPRNPLATIGPGAFEFENEDALTFEVGSKMTLLEGTAELNIALFRTNYENLQVSIYDGVLGFNVDNAAEANIWGVELDGRWAITDNLMLSAALGTLDFEFEDYDSGECYVGQTPDSTVGGQGFCDYAGQTNQYVADWSGMLSADHFMSLGSSLQMQSTVDFVFSDEYFTSQKNDPATVQDAYMKVNARVALSGLYDLWEVAIFGRNLTDEKVVPYTNNTPLSDTIAGANSHYGFVDPPRSIGIQATWRF
jgi:iron complex outermembrane receptor protein